MRKQLIYLGLLCLLLLNIYTVSAEKISIATGEWSPWISKDLPDNGILPRILAEALAEQGIEFEYHFMSWNQALTQLDQGKVQASLPWYGNKARAQKYYFSKALVRSQTAFFHLKEKPFSWQGDFNNLSPYRIGASANYSYGAGFDRAEKYDRSIRVKRLKTYQPDIHNLKKLLQQEIDLFPMDINVGYYLLHHSFGPEAVKQVSHAEPTLHQTSLHLITKRDRRNIPLLKTLDARLKNLGSERIEAMVKNYGKVAKR